MSIAIIIQAVAIPFVPIAFLEAA
jgi:hypothetical protein